MVINLNTGFDKGEEMAKNKNIIEGQLNLFAFLEEEDAQYIGKEQKTVSQRGGLRTGEFNECKSCWCSDCKHNALNEGVPRDICGNMLSCPACDMCLNTGIAEICVIGSADEGCSVRAAEEGI